MKALTLIWGFLNLWRETPQEKSLRVRNERARRARENLRRNIEFIKAERRKQYNASLDRLGEEAMREPAGYELTELGEDALRDLPDETEFESSYHPHPHGGEAA